MCICLRNIHTKCFTAQAKRSYSSFFELCGKRWKDENIKLKHQTETSNWNIKLKQWQIPFRSLVALLFNPRRFERYESRQIRLFESDFDQAERDSKWFGIERCVATFRFEIFEFAAKLSLEVFQCWLDMTRYDSIWFDSIWLDMVTIRQTVHQTDFRFPAFLSVWNWQACSSATVSSKRIALSFLDVVASLFGQPSHCRLSTASAETWALPSAKDSNRQ